MADHWRGEWSDVEASFARMGVADGVAVHHTASLPQGDTYDPAYLRRVEHAEIAAGYNALAYHTMWFDDGSSAESRPYGAMGAATGGHNGHTIAHCAMGYFHQPYNNVPSDQMCIRIADEIRWTRENGFLTPDAPVLPHTVWTAGTQWATACCGSEFIPKVAWIDEMSRIGAGPPEPPTPGPLILKEEDMFVAFVVFNGVHCYLISAMNGKVLHEFLNEDVNQFGIPNQAADFGQRYGMTKINGDQWGNIIKTGNITGSS